MDTLAEIRLGTSSFTAAGWEGSFYPKGIKSAGRLSPYAEHFDTVEIDSTFYACPSPADSGVLGSPGLPRISFLLVKVPQIVTHERVLVGCHPEFRQFVETMEILGNKLGPMVLQFPFFRSAVFKSRTDFLDRLIPFLKKLPRDHKFAVEIRNVGWLDAQFAGVLRDFGVALVLQDQSRMPPPKELSQRFDPITTDWAYIRWLGDRKGIERLTTTWDKAVIDRTTEIRSWVDVCYETVRRGVKVFGYANNHYGGHAPATIRQFRELWRGKGLPEIEKPFQPLRERTLFRFLGRNERANTSEGDSAACAPLPEPSVCFLRGDVQMAGAFPLRPDAETIHVEVHDRSRKKCQHLAEDQAAHDRNSQRDTQFRADSLGQSKR